MHDTAGISLVRYFVYLDQEEELSYVVVLENWQIPADNLKVLEKRLGEGQFGIVKQGILTTGKGDPEVVAVKMLKGRRNDCI